MVEIAGVVILIGVAGIKNAAGVVEVVAPGSFFGMATVFAGAPAVREGEGTQGQQENYEGNPVHGVLLSIEYLLYTNAFT